MKKKELADRLERLEADMVVLRESLDPPAETENEVGQPRPILSDVQAHVFPRTEWRSAYTVPNTASLSDEAVGKAWVAHLIEVALRGGEVRAGESHIQHVLDKVVILKEQRDTLRIKLATLKAELKNSHIKKSQYPHRVKPGIWCYGEFLFVVYDGTDSLLGATTTLDEAEKLLNAELQRT